MMKLTKKPEVSITSGSKVINLFKRIEKNVLNFIRPLYIYMISDYYVYATRSNNILIFLFLSEVSWILPVLRSEGGGLHEAPTLRPPLGVLVFMQWRAFHIRLKYNFEKNLRWSLTNHFSLYSIHSLERNCEIVFNRSWPDNFALYNSAACWPSLGCF